MFVSVSHGVSNLLKQLNPWIVMILMLMFVLIIAEFTFVLSCTYLYMWLARTVSLRYSEILLTLFCNTMLICLTEAM